jgi:hypothetical protein
MVPAALAANRHRRGCLGLDFNLSNFAVIRNTQRWFCPYRL